MSLRGRDLLSAADLSAAEVEVVFDRAAELKAEFRADRRHAELPLAGRTLAMLFQKPSLRTRVTFEAGMTQLGGHAVHLATHDVGLGTRESVSDVARNLDRWVDGIMVRTFGHAIAEEIAAAASIPVINALTDLEHPCQALADLFTLRERFGTLDGLSVAFVGDGNNVFHSLALLGARLGVEIRLAHPPGHGPDPAIVARARSIATTDRLTLGEDPLMAVRGADVVYTDAWASMGQEFGGGAQAHRIRRLPRRRATPFGRRTDYPRHALPACPSRRGDHLRRPRWAAQPGPGTGREPPPRAEGVPGRESRRSMSEEALYERYKSALRVGHVASVRGRDEAAVAAYSEAASLAPDRPLPHASMGRSLLRLGRLDQALAAFGEALRLAPRDEASLAGRADVLIAAGRPAEAAGVLDLLADTQEKDGRLPDACDTARRALELAESRARRRSLEALVAALRTSTADGGGGGDQLARALRTLEAPLAEAGPSPADGGAAADRAPSETNAAADGPASVAEPEPLLPLPDAGALSIAIETAVETGDPAVVHEVVLGAVGDMRRGGLLDAAIDAIQLGLTVAPADPDLHLALAELDLDHGWATAAADKLVILDRYIELTDNGPARERLRALVDARIPDDPRLSAPRS